VAELRTYPDLTPPRPTEGTELLGEDKGSGLQEAPYLVRRGDGQFVHLSRLLYLVAEAADGRRDFGQIAERVSQGFGRQVSAENVRYLVEKELCALGVLEAAEGESVEPQRPDAPLLGLNYRLGLVPAGIIRFITTPFLPLFRLPVVVSVLGALVAVDLWLYFHGILQGIQQIIYQPALVLALFALEMAAMAFHECGHVSACRYGGAKPGVVGVGIYIIWIVFYSDVTDSYRLDKLGRLRTDLGGMYFDAIFTLVLAGVYFISGFEPLLVLILFNQLGSLAEFSPLVRLDGYYVLSDLTGVADLYGSIEPTLRRLIFGPAEADDHGKELKPWVRVVITVWVVMVVLAVMVSLMMLVIYGPWAIATTWDSFFVQYGQLSSAFEEGRMIEGILGLINVGFLLVPVVGGALLLARVSKRWGVAAWRLTRGRSLLRLGIVLALIAVMGLSLFLFTS
jgi:putative peptide zinc metalloprotease protein